jgi:hypothetical protein
MAKDPRDTGDLVRISIFLFDRGPQPKTMLNLVEKHHPDTQKTCTKRFIKAFVVFMQQPSRRIAVFVLFD